MPANGGIHIITNFEEVLENIAGYLISLPQEALSGDLFAIMLSLVILYVLAILIIKSARVMAGIIKKLVIFLIIIIAFYIFLQDFILKIVTYGLTPDVVIFGLTGLLCGIFAFLIAFFTIHKALKKRKEEKKKTQPQAVQPETYIVISPPPSSHEETAYPDQYQLPFIPSQLSDFAKDNSIGMVIIYLIVAEFGIFSSKTIAASNADTGLTFFLIFMAAALVFIKLTYNDYKTGLKHFVLAFVLGFSLSIVLGYFWGGIPLSVLLSKEYFATDALVALITGLSLSLFMSGKG